MDSLLPTSIPPTLTLFQPLPEREEAETCDKFAEALIGWYSENMGRFTEDTMIVESMKPNCEQLVDSMKTLEGIKHPITGEAIVTVKELGVYKEVSLAMNGVFQRYVYNLSVSKEFTSKLETVKAELLLVDQGHKAAIKDEGPCNGETVAKLMKQVLTAEIIANAGIKRHESASWGVSTRTKKIETALQTFQHTLDGYVDKAKLPMWGMNQLRLPEDEELNELAAARKELAEKKSAALESQRAHQDDDESAETQILAPLTTAEDEQ